MKQLTEAQILFAENSKKARELVKIGKASNLKEAWAIIKAENEASKEVPAEPIAQVFYNGLW